MKKLTIFTPTYNRGYCLHNCYESLKHQTSKDFIWLIIDDGSIDDTKEMVDKWIKEGVVHIQYHYQNNQGMHGAHNTAYEQITTELNVCIDSDDYMTNDAVENILTFWDKYGGKNVSGIIGLNSDPKAQVIGTGFPTHLKQSTLFDLYSKHGVVGDKKLVYRTELTKKYPYPLFKTEKYVGLAYKYFKLDIDYEMLLLNKPLCIVEYLPDGSSQNMFRQYMSNPRGFSFYRIELMKLPFTSRLYRFRQAIHYVSSSFIGRNWSFMKETPSKVLTALAFPLGVLLYFYIKTKTRTT